jgi:hypothetical protein
MPKGMFLRSGCDWHLDPQNVHTIEAYLQELGKTASKVGPLSLEFYLDFVDWFQSQKRIEPGEAPVLSVVTTTCLLVKSWVLVSAVALLEWVSLSAMDCDRSSPSMSVRLKAVSILRRRGIIRVVRDDSQRLIH